MRKFLCRCRSSIACLDWRLSILALYHKSIGKCLKATIASRPKCLECLCLCRALVTSAEERLVELCHSQLCQIQTGPSRSCPTVRPVGPESLSFRASREKPVQVSREHLSKSYFCRAAGHAVTQVVCSHEKCTIGVPYL